MKAGRKSGIELLRIIAMLMIVAHHFVLNTDWTLWAGNSINSYLVEALVSFGKVGVGVFFIISGFFMAQSKAFTYKKAFRVLRPMWFYSLGFLLLSFIVLPNFFSFSLPLPLNTARMLFPFLTNTYWFVSSYAAINLLFPYIRKWLDALKDKELICCFLIMVAFYVIPKIFSVFVVNYNTAIMEFPSALLYSYIGYLIFRFKKVLSNKSALIGIVVSFLFILVSPLIKHVLQPSFTAMPYDYFWEINSLPCILLSSSLFIIFSQFNFRNGFINYCADLMFGVYLIHSNTFIKEILWGENGIIHANKYIYSSPLHFFAYCAATIMAIFVVCMIIEAIRKSIVSLYLKIRQRIKTSI